MLCLKRKNWVSKKDFQETCLKAFKISFRGVCSVDCTFYILFLGRDKCEKSEKLKSLNDDLLFDQLSKLVIEPNFIVDFLTAK